MTDIKKMITMVAKERQDARRKALEEAALICEHYENTVMQARKDNRAQHFMGASIGAGACAERIRAAARQSAVEVNDVQLGHREHQNMDKWRMDEALNGKEAMVTAARLAGFQFWKMADGSYQLKKMVVANAQPVDTVSSIRPTDDSLWDKTIADRDSYHDIADQLAAQIAAITGEDIGEHSSANDPWHNAMLAADEYIAQKLRALCSVENSGTNPIGYVSQQAFAQMADIRYRVEVFPSSETLLDEYPDAIPIAVFSAPPEKQASHSDGDAEKLPVKYYKDGGTTHAVYGSSSISYVETLRARFTVPHPSRNASDEETQRLR